MTGSAASSPLIETVSSVAQVMPGGSGFSSLVETTAGRRFVMKLGGVGQGVAGLLTELVAIRLAGTLGLKVPRSAPLMLSQAHPWQVGTDEFYEAMQRSAGWNLGIEFIGDAQDVSADALQDLPPAFLDRLAAVDALLQNVDRTRKNPNLLRDRDGTCWAIDFGACMFLHRFAREGARMRFELPAAHFLAGRQAVLHMPEGEGLRNSLAQIVADVPAAWLEDMPGGRQSLLDNLEGCVDAYCRSEVIPSRQSDAS